VNTVYANKTTII